MIPHWKIDDYLHPIYPNELEVKDTINDTPKSASSIVIYLEIDNRWKLKTKLYDKRDEFVFPIINFPFNSSNIPASPAYEVYSSQLICFSMECAQYSDFLDKAQILKQKLLKEGHVALMMKSSLQKFVITIVSF